MYVYVACSTLFDSLRKQEEDEVRTQPNPTQPHPLRVTVLTSGKILMQEPVTWLGERELTTSERMFYFMGRGELCMYICQCKAGEGLIMEWLFCV